jgi:hypothetical protein
MGLHLEKEVKTPTLIFNNPVLARFPLEGILKVLPILDIDITVLWDYVEKMMVLQLYK